MLALTKITKRRIGTVRTVMEVAVAVIGYLLGGLLAWERYFLPCLWAFFWNWVLPGSGLLKQQGSFRLSGKRSPDCFSKPATVLPDNKNLLPIMWAGDFFF